LKSAIACSRLAAWLLGLFLCILIFRNVFCGFAATVPLLFDRVAACGRSHELSIMRPDKALPVSVVALRAESYSPDGNVVISLRTKFSNAERKYSVPLECFHDLVVDLQRLNVSKAVEPSTQPDVRFVAEADIPADAN
jgi:hypothetical protein